MCEVAIILGIMSVLAHDNSSLGHRLTYSAVIIRNNLAAHNTAISRVPTEQILVCLISYHDPIVLGFEIIVKPQFPIPYPKIQETNTKIT